MVTHNGYASALEIEAAASLLSSNFNIWTQGSLTVTMTCGQIFSQICHFLQSFYGYYGPTLQLLLANSHYYLLQQGADTCIEIPQPQIISNNCAQQIAQVTSLSFGNSDLTNLPNQTEKHQRTRPCNEGKAAAQDSARGNGDVKRKKDSTGGKKNLMDLEAQCRKLGIPYETANTIETSLDELHRRNRNLRKLKKAEQQLHIDDVQSIPDAPPLSDDSFFQQCNVQNMGN